MTDLGTGFGKAVWTDYESHWTEDSAFWLRDRSIVRYELLADLPATAEYGEFAYVQEYDLLYRWSSENDAWGRYAALPDYMLATEDPTQVTIGWWNGAAPGSFVPAAKFSSIGLEVPTDIDIKPNEVTAFKVTANDITIATQGGTTVVGSTDADGLVFDKAVKAAGLTSTGSASVAGAVTAGSLAAGAVTADSLDVDGPVTLDSLDVAGALTAGEMFVNNGRFGGDSDGPVMEYESGASLRINGGYVRFDGTAFRAYDQVQIRGENGATLVHRNKVDSSTRPYGVVIAQSNQPTAANWPDGTLWVKI